MADKFPRISQFWTVAEAVNWIAFQTEPEDAPDTIIANPDSDRITDPRLMALLRAVAFRKPGAPLAMAASRDGETPDTSPATYQALIESWMTDEGLDAKALLEKAEASLLRYRADRIASEQQQALLAAALDEFNDAVQGQALVARGRPSTTRYYDGPPAVREPLPAELIDEPRRISMDGVYSIREDQDGFAWLHDPGPFFRDVVVYAADVRRLWASEPTTAASRSEKAPSITVRRVAAVAQDNQGRNAAWPVKLALWIAYLRKYQDPDCRPSRGQQKADMTHLLRARKCRAATHADMKLLRAHPATPEEWRERGRKPKSRFETE